MAIRHNSLVMVIVWLDRIEVTQVVYAGNKHEALKRGALRVELVKVNSSTPDSLKD